MGMTDDMAAAIAAGSTPVRIGTAFLAPATTRRPDTQTRDLMQHRKITFIGAGNMARAIIAGTVAGGYPAKSISVCAPSPKNRDALAADYGIVSSGDNVACAREAEVVVLAVKPQMMADVCQRCASRSISAANWCCRSPPVFRSAVSISCSATSWTSCASCPTPRRWSARA